MAKSSKSKKINVTLLLTVAVAGWFIPGAGHWLIKERKRAIIIFLTITLLFTLGIYIGSIGVIDPVNEKLWYIAQRLNSPFVAALGYLTATRGYESFGKPNAIGQIYTSIGGMLNLLCIINVVHISDLRSRGQEEQ